MRMKIGTTTLENGLVSPNKVEDMQTLLPSNYTPDYIPNRNLCNCIPQDTNKNVHCHTVCKSLKQETCQTLTNSINDFLNMYNHTKE